MSCTQMECIRRCIGCARPSEISKCMVFEASLVHRWLTYCVMPASPVQSLLPGPGKWFLRQLRSSRGSLKCISTCHIVGRQQAAKPMSTELLHDCR